MSKTDVATFLHSLPGADDFFGGSKIDDWAAGKIFSVNYEKYYIWMVMNHRDWIQADVQRHTGIPDPNKQQTVSDAYKPIIDFLTTQLANQNDALAQYKDNALAEATISEELSRTAQALNYYKSLSIQ